MDVRRVVATWYQGRRKEPLVGEHIVIFPGERYERHWSSSAAHVLVDFYLEHWKWVIATALAVIGTAVAIFH
jgi:hypothetical protein